MTSSLCWARHRIMKNFTVLKLLDRFHFLFKKIGVDYPTMRRILQVKLIMDVVEKISSRIILINNGQIVADGSFDQLSQKCREGSLEEIFNQLTGFNRHKEIADEFIAVLGDA